MGPSTVSRLALCAVATWSCGGETASDMVDGSTVQSDAEARADALQEDAGVVDSSQGVCSGTQPACDAGPCYCTWREALESPACEDLFLQECTGGVGAFTPITAPDVSTTCFYSLDGGALVAVIGGGGIVGVSQSWACVGPKDFLDPSRVCQRLVPYACIDGEGG